MSTTLVRPFSADFSHSTAFNSLPARQRPKSQTFRSSPLAGPALSVSQLTVNDSRSKQCGKANDHSEQQSTQRRRPLSFKASSASAETRITLADLGAVRTTSGVAFPHKRPSSTFIDTKAKSNNDKRSSVPVSSLRPPRLPFASETNTRPSGTRTSTINTAPPRARSSPNLDPEYHWLTTGHTPVFSRTQIYTQNIIMPVRAPHRRQRKSTSTSSSSSSTGGGSTSSASASASLTRNSSDTSVTSSMQGGVSAVPSHADALTFVPRKKSVADGQVDVKQARRRTLSERLRVLVRSKSISELSVDVTEPAAPEEASPTTIVYNASPIEATKPASLTVPAPFPFLNEDPATLLRSTGEADGREVGERKIGRRLSAQLRAVSESVPPRRRRTVTPAIRVHPASSEGGEPVDGEGGQSGVDSPTLNKVDGPSPLAGAPEPATSRGRRRTILGIPVRVPRAHLLSRSRSRKRSLDGSGVLGAASVSAESVCGCALPSKHAKGRGSWRSKGEVKSLSASRSVGVSASPPSLPSLSLSSSAMSLSSSSFAVEGVEELQAAVTSEKAGAETEKGEKVAVDVNSVEESPERKRKKSLRLRITISALRRSLSRKSAKKPGSP